MPEISHIVEATRTLVLHPYFTGKGRPRREIDAQLDEAIGLAAAIELNVVDAQTVPLRSYTPATLLGSGKVVEMGDHIQALEAELVVIDTQLTPVQQRNLEKEWNVKVIDRTALILEIFGARARTHEGKLQVELAALTYQKGRLVRSWTHLERQRGGGGFLGGPGESQMELDRRMLDDRILKIKKELKEVTRTRELHRKTRREVPYPLVAIVGYTNAGKSTLFNRLSGAQVMAKDMLFATLDPTMRALTLPSGLRIILSDTVGFVSNLPHELVAAFRATLEEVVEAHVILHVRDIAHHDTAAQKDDVLDVLHNLLDEKDVSERLLEVHNKVDLLPEDAQIMDRADLPRISALTGLGVDELVAALDDILAARFTETLTLTVKSDDTKTLEWVYKNGRVLENEQGDETATLTVQFTKENAARVARLTSASS
jgi:GTP-binding protein HflX